MKPLDEKRPNTERKAVFFDRDATLNSDEGHYYVYSPQDFVLNAGVVEGLRLLQAQGYLLFVVTNQGGVAKGLFSTQDVEKVHQKMQHLLEKEGIVLTGIAYCPHHESVSECSCRKPKPQMILDFMKTHRLKAANCTMIGDSERDRGAAEAAGIRFFKIAKNANIFPFCQKIVSNE